MVKQGEVWICRLDPTVGSEIRKSRPCLVASPDELNRQLRTFLAVPMTTGGRIVPFRVPTQFGGRDGLILPDQLRVLDKSRLITRAGRLDPDKLDEVLAVLRNMFQT